MTMPVNTRVDRVSQPALQARRDARPAPRAAPALIGPNAVIQTLEALRAPEGPGLAERVASAADLPEREPEALVPEAWFVRLVAALRRELPRDRAEKVLAHSGAATARYVAVNRIPSAFRALLRLLPARVAIPLLLAAFRRHAWTFAGQSGFEVQGRYPGSIVLDDAPTCRHETHPAGSGSYYEAAFEGLLSLASPRVRVTEVDCRASGAPACRFLIRLDNEQFRG